VGLKKKKKDSKRKQKKGRPTRDLEVRKSVREGKRAARTENGVSKTFSIDEVKLEVEGKQEGRDGSWGWSRKSARRKRHVPD